MTWLTDAVGRHAADILRELATALIQLADQLDGGGQAVELLGHLAS